jgi:uncharacterized protein YcfL
MHKYSLFLILFLLAGCTTTKNYILTNNTTKSLSISDEMNKSIIDGFFDNDTTGISNKIYLMK